MISMTDIFGRRRAVHVSEGRPTTFLDTLDVFCRQGTQAGLGSGPGRARLTTTSAVVCEVEKSRLTCKKGNAEQEFGTLIRALLKAVRG